MVLFSNSSRSWRHLSTLVITNMVLLLALLAVAFPSIARGESYSTTVGAWILSDLFEVNWTFAIDALTYTMLFVVLSVSTLVHLYSTEYMSEDPHTGRFISYLSLFTFFMLILVTSNNFVGLFLGWEGVGLCSYLLISFWFTRIQANKAAIKAMVVNRVSDLFFTIGILAIFFTFQTVEFNTVFALAPYFVENATVSFGGYMVPPLTLITFLLFLGAMGKSAQIGLHTWLPDAMEGWHHVGLSIKKILPYAGITSVDTTVESWSLLFAAVEKSVVEEVDPQETDISLLGSSETLRKTTSPFNFTPFLAASHRRGGDFIFFLEWLIGFTEGDGSFIVDSTGYVSFQITQSYCDVRILHHIRRTLGFGYVTQQDAQNNTWRFRVRDKLNLEKIILIFNGNLVLEKNRDRFRKFVTAYNACYRSDFKINLHAPCATLNDAWLSGFADAEGCFTVSVIDRLSRAKKLYQVQAWFILPQKGADKELSSISELVGGRLSFQKSYGGHNLSVQITRLKPVLAYFRRFPLKTIKRISLIKFLVIYRIVTSSIAKKQPLDAKELFLIRTRAKEINKITGLIEDKVRSTG